MFSICHGLCLMSIIITLLHGQEAKAITCIKSVAKADMRRSNLAAEGETAMVEPMRKVEKKIMVNMFNFLSLLVDKKL